MFPMSVDRKVGIEYDPPSSQRKTCSELIRLRKCYLAMVVNGTRWPVTHATEIRVFFFFKLAFDYLKMKYVMGEVHRDNSTIKPAEKA